MAKMKGGLGRGLQSLFDDAAFNSTVSVTPNLENNGNNKADVVDLKAPAKNVANTVATEKDTAEKVVYIKLADIKPNDKQPRIVFNEEALKELADSIKTYGVIQPVLVRPAKRGFELVAGERRWRAARLAGLSEIPAIVRDLTEEQNAFYALIENMQREDLNIVEEALGIEKMIEDFGLSQEEAARAVGKSRPYVTNALRLLKLPKEVIELIKNKELSAGHARAIAGLSTEELQLEAARKAVKEGWSVRKIESYTGSKAPKKAGKKDSKDGAIKAVEQELTELVGTKVQIQGNQNKGKLVIQYYSKSELENLIELLKK